MWQFVFMKFFSRELVDRLAEAIHKAVPAVSSKQVLPRWRNLGRQITPYHYMQPILVPVKNRRG